MKLVTEEKIAFTGLAGLFGCAGLYFLSIIALILACVYGIYRLIVHFL